MLKLCVLVAALTKIFTVSALVFNVPSSTVKEVRIGGTIAEVSREFQLRLIPNGFHSIVVNHLPDTIDEKSIQVAGLGDAEVVSTTIHNQVVPRDHDEDFASLLQSLGKIHTTLTGGLHSLTIDHRRVSQRIASLDSYVQDAVRTSVSKTIPLTLEQLTETLDYQEKALTGLNEKIISLDRTINATQSCIEALCAMIDKLQKLGHYQNILASQLNIPAEVLNDIKKLPVAERVWPSSIPTKQLHINIHVPDTSALALKTLTFAIEYMTSPASWQAEYDMRLDSPSPVVSTATSSTPSKEYKLRVGMYANVAQSTQEDWTDVQLHLSTSQPQQHIYPLSSPQRTSITYQPDLPPPMYYNEGMTARAGGSTKQMKRESRSFAQADIGMAQDAAGAGEILLMQGISTAEVGMTGQAGSLGSAVVFTPAHRVNITSNPRSPVNYAHHQHNMRSGMRPVQDEIVLNNAPVTSTRLFIKEFTLSPLVFTYAVPTMHVSGLRAWVLNNNDQTDSVPLLDSPHGRVFIDNTFTGSTSISATQPGSPVRLELGADRNIQISSTFVLPRQGSQTEDKAGWFVNDKIKYKVEMVEYAFTVRSTHTAPHLVILSEYLPHVGEEGIKVKLLKPAKEDILQVNGEAGHQDVWNEQDFVAAVLTHPKLAKPADKASTSDKMLVFVSEGSRNIVYAQWVQPGQTLQTGLKYRIVWPDGKNINKQMHY